MLTQLLFWLFAIMIAITIHEFSHAWVANKLGDPTAKREGRISLNPKDHIDPIGFIALLIVHFGWGKPVPVNPYNLKHPRRDQAIIALAGPFSNFIIAAILTIPAAYLANPLLVSFFDSVIYINLILMIFNLIPIPPLDGSNVMFAFFPPSWWKTEEMLRKNGAFILIAALLIDSLLQKNFQFSVFGTIIGTGVNALQALLKLTS